MTAQYISCSRNLSHTWCFGTNVDPKIYPDTSHYDNFTLTTIHVITTLAKRYKCLITTHETPSILQMPSRHYWLAWFGADISGGRPSASLVSLLSSTFTPSNLCRSRATRSAQPSRSLPVLGSYGPAVINSSSSSSDGRASLSSSSLENWTRRPL